MGHKVWKSSEWTSALQLMEEVLDDHPSLDIWNELVLQVPSSDSEADFANHTVQAVFYVKENGLVMDEVAREIAKREANRMNKPLMYIILPDDLDDGNHDLFHCEDMGGSGPMFLRGPN